MNNRPRIYLDAAPLIDLAKEKVGVPLRDDERQRDVWFIGQMLKAAQDGKVDLFTSVLTIAECTHVEEEKHLESAKLIYMGLLASGKSGIRLVQPVLAIAEKARDLRWIGGVSLRGADAIHVASAMKMSCDELLTTDQKMLKNGNAILALGVRVCRPSQSRLLPAEYLQSELDLSPPQV